MRSGLPRSLLVALAGLWAAGACSAGGAGGGGAVGQPQPPEPHAGGPIDAGIDAVVRAARADAAERTGWPPAEFEVVKAEPVTWRDGSLGCPAPGRLYTQALVPGYRVLLRAQGRQFDYHAGARGGLMLCPQGRAVEPLPDDRR